MPYDCDCKHFFQNFKVTIWFKKTSEDVQNVLTTTTATRKWEMSLCCPWLDINRLACLMNRKKCESCFFVFIFLLLCFSSLILYACICVVYRSKSANNETIRHWSPTFSQGRKIKLFCCFILSYLPSFLPRYNVRIFRSLEKGGQSQFLPWAISFPFLKFMFRRKKCFFLFLFLFLLQLSSLSWNLFLLSLTHLFPCCVLHLIFLCFF